MKYKPPTRADMLKDAASIVQYLVNHHHPVDEVNKVKAQTYRNAELWVKDYRKWKAYRRKRNKRDVVQIKNPKSGRYVKIDRGIGKILSYKKSVGPYKNVPIATAGATMRAGQT